MIGLWGEMGHPWRYILSYGKYFKWIVSSLMTAGTPTLHQHTRFAGNIKPTELQSSTFYFLSHFILKFAFSPPLMMVVGNNTMAPPGQLQPSVGWIDGTFRQTWPVTLLGSVSCNHLLLCFSISDQTVVVVIDDPAFCFRCQGPLHTWTVIPQQKPRIAVCNTLCLNNFLSLLQ